MPWKMKDNVLVVDNGNPVWVGDDGKEANINGGEVLGKITQLGGEAATHRKAKEAAEKALQAFGSLDPVKAQEALDKLLLIDQSKLIDAGKVEEVKASITAQFKTQIEAEQAKTKTLEGQLNNALIGNAFATVADKFTIPPDAVAKLFGDRFAVKDGKVITRDANGNAVLSTKNIGQEMDFSEGFETVLNSFAGKDAILKGANHNGTGGQGGGGGQGGKRRLTRSDEAKLPLQQKADFHKEVREGKAELIDG